MVLRVKLEVVPFGEEERAYEIGRLDIFNERHEGNGVYAYGAIEMTPQSGGLYRKPVLFERAQGAWRLVRAVLEKLDIAGPSS